MNSKDAFKRSGLNSQFNFGHLSFHRYVEEMRAIIEATRTDLNGDDHEVIVDANSPYEWIPTSPHAKSSKTGKIKRGILLVHGLYDSPVTLQSLAEFFQQHNFLVRSILLPGHGTNPGDLIDVSYNEWLKATQYGIESFADEVEELFLCGFSTGGALILHQALEQDIKNLHSIILFAPAIKLQTPIAILSNLDNLMHQTIGGIKWVTKSANYDYAKYLSFTFNSAHQVYLLSNKLARKLKRKTFEKPIFLVATQDDEVLAVKSMINFFSAMPNPLSRMSLYGNNKINDLDKRINIFPSAYPEKQILNFSHICLPISPTHIHYGANGDYHDFLHYEEGLHKRPKVITEDFKFGAIIRSNVRNHFMRRLTYNPDFYNMAVRLKTFVGI